MSVKIYIPGDSGSVALGADRLAIRMAEALKARDLDAEIIRNGSRGLYWLEPMVEVETGKGRVAYGPVKASDVDGLLEAGLLEGGDHPLSLGAPEEMPFLKRQTRLTFARCGITDPLSLEDYRDHGGLTGLTNAVAMEPEAIVAQVTESGLRGRGGAGFPTGIKWKTVLEAEGRTEIHRLQRRRGRFRHLRRPHDHGRRSLRADRGHGDRRHRHRRDQRLRLPALGISACDPGHEPRGRDRPRGRDSRHLGAGLGSYLRHGNPLAQGAYVCGEETALLESLEGRRGVVRAKPPLPAHKGFLGRPTVVNNVISLASVPVIMDKGADFYRDFGMGRSRGTIPVQIAGNVKHGGLFEAAFGMSLGELVDDIAGGTATGRPVKAVQVGGPLGAYFPRELFDTPFDYEAFAAKDGLIGHAGIVVFDDTADMLKQARFAFEFCAVESCGKCTPCRIGSTRGVEVADKIRDGIEPESQITLMTDLCNTMKFGSLCALGGFTPYPVMSALTHFPEDFRPAQISQAAE
jgi:formate dehydrogenase iron-sulfur subunit